MRTEQTEKRVAGETSSPNGSAFNGAAAEAPSSEARGGRPGVPGVLRNREFAFFWVGQTISLIGTWMQSFAQGWVVANLTTSAFALGLVMFVQSVPTLLLTPLGGVAADRMERRRILIVTQWAMLILAATMGVLIAARRLELWHVYLIAVPLGVATAYELPAYQSFYPQLIPRQYLPQAISLNQATFHGARIIGPALASAFVALWGTAAAFFANAASFLAVIISLGMIRPRPAAVEGSRTSAWVMMGEGIRYVRDRPKVQALLGLTAITTLFIFPNLAILTPYYARHVLHVGPEGLGLMMSVSGGGSLLGAALLLSVPPERRVQRIAVAVCSIVAGMSVFAWSRHLWVSVAAMLPISFAIAHSLGLASIIIQEMVPEELRGRVMSLYSLTFTGIMPFGALLIPSVVDAIGMRWELQGAAVLYAAAGLVLIGLLRRGSVVSE
jgi:MFS family permease